MKIHLGKRYRCMVTKREGVATCFTNYLSGCDQVGIASVEDGGERYDFYVDVNLVEELPGEAITPTDQRLRGGPQPAPAAPQSPPFR